MNEQLVTVDFRIESHDKHPVYQSCLSVIERRPLDSRLLFRYFYDVINPKKNGTSFSFGENTL